MSRSAVFYDVPRTTFSDQLSEFVSGFSFVLNSFGHQHDNPYAICGNRVTGNFELVFVKGGKSLVTVLGQEYECLAGDAVLIPPFTLHKIQTPTDDPHDNYWMHFDVFPFYRQGQLAQSLCPGGTHKASVENTAGLLALYLALEGEALVSRPGHFAYCNALLSQIMLLLLRERGAGVGGEEKLSKASSMEERIVNGALQYIQEHITESIRVDDICTSLFVSASTLFKAFSAVLHSPPSHFIQLCKMKEAERLLNATTFSVKEISQMLAFSSPFYFSSVFKKFYGVAPRDYQRNLQL